MTTPFENFVNTALGKSVSADVTLPTANDIPVFTGIGRQVTGKTTAELGLALSADKKTTANGGLTTPSDGTYPSSLVVANELEVVASKDYFYELLNTAGNAVGNPLVIGRNYRRAGGAIADADTTAIWLPAATAGSLAVAKSKPIVIMVGDGNVTGSYQLKPQVGETINYTDAGTAAISTTTSSVLISNNSIVTCHMVGLGTWFVTIQHTAAKQPMDQFAPRGYTVGVVYAVGALVLHQGHEWRVVVAHTGTIPFVNGNLELTGAVFNTGVVSSSYTAQRLYGIGDPVVLNKTLEVYASGATFTLDVTHAPRKVLVKTGQTSSTMTLTITRSGISFYTDRSQTSVGTGTYSVIVPGGSSVEIFNWAGGVLVNVIALTGVTNHKIIDNNVTNSSNNNGWVFSGTATGERVISLPNFDTNLTSIRRKVQIASGALVDYLLDNMETHIELTGAAVSVYVRPPYTNGGGGYLFNATSADVTVTFIYEWTGQDPFFTSSLRVFYTETATYAGYTSTGPGSSGNTSASYVLKPGETVRIAVSGGPTSVQVSVYSNAAKEVIDTNFRIKNTPLLSYGARFEVSALTSVDRVITVPDANVDLGIVPNATSSTTYTGAFVYATGMGSVVKTITGSGATFDIDELENNKAHSVTIRSNADSTSPFDTTTTFSFVSTKSFGAGTGFCDEGGVGSLGSCASGSPFVVTLAPNESWEVRYIGGSGLVSYFSVKRNFTRWTAIPADVSVTLVAGFAYVATNTSTGKTYTLPITPSIGTIVRLKCNNFVAYNQTLARNGSSIDGVASNITLNRNGTYTFLYNALSTWETSFEDSVYLDANVISGTRNRVVGGSSNTVSGTDNVAINCYATTLGSSATSVTAISCSGVAVTRTTTKAFLAGCSDIILRPEAPHNNGLVALGVAYKTDVFSEFPQWAGHTIIGTEDGIHACITVYGSNTAAGNVNLTSSTGVKPLAAIGGIVYRKGVQHIIHLIGQNSADTPNKVVTVAYKVVSYADGGGIALGAVQTIESLFNAVGTPATPTVTISITAYDRLNINVASADAMYWAARVDSYFA